MINDEEIIFISLLATCILATCTWGTDNHFFSFFDGVVCFYVAELCECSKYVGYMLSGQDVHIFTLF